jgi:hypothetical protein
LMLLTTLLELQPNQSDPQVDLAGQIGCIALTRHSERRPVTTSTV